MSNYNTFALQFSLQRLYRPLPPQARMAESVDALVSNTNVRKDVPVRPRLRVQRKPRNRLIMRLFIFSKVY